MTKCFVLLILLLTFSFTKAQSSSKPALKILFIPLDDRPPCLQFTQKIGLIGNADLIVPPKDILGKFTTPGQSEKIISWLRQQDLASFQAAVISVDMLVYGGLVASRAPNVETSAASQRIEVLAEIHKKAPAVPIYAQSVIMRIAPTADGKNDAYKDNLSKWAEISVLTDEKSQAETKILTGKIPAKAITDYKNARQRNLTINLKAIEYVKSGVIHYLLLSQDDAKPVGIHVSDRVELVARTKNLGLGNKIAVQPGADEVSMLLLARALNNYYKVQPKIKAVFSSGIAANKIMPFEDKPLKETVSYHIRATGSQEVQDEKKADLLFYVFASRHDAGRAISFAAEIEAQVKKGRSVIVADIDPIGDVQGGDSAFTIELENRELLPELNGYASWNTAANTIGTTLPQGIIFRIAEARLLKNKSIASSIITAQNWFTFHRVLDDYYFHGSVRSKANIYFGQPKMSSKILDEAANKKMEDYTQQLLLKSFEELSGIYTRKIPNSRQQNIQCRQPSGLSFKLPWNRTFEAEIDFKMDCILLDRVF